MAKPLVSVILPFLNAGPAFGPALRSMLQQTSSNWELLLCDDGSTDGSLEMAQSIPDSRVTVWSDGQTKGRAARLNECLLRARGELVARMDADDVSYPQRLQSQVTFLRMHPEIDVVGCRMLIFGEGGSPLGKRPLPLQHEEIVSNPAAGFGLAHPTWRARAAWYRQHRYDPSALRFEDAELLHRTYLTSRFANLPQLLYGYRELRGGFRKRLKTRLGRVRYLHARSGETGPRLFYRAALAESFKVAADGLLAITGTRYPMLRLREEPLDAAERMKWQAMFAALTQNSSPLTLESAQA